MTFHASGEMVLATWKAVLDKAEKHLEEAQHFKLSFTERAYVIKTCVSIVARIAKLPHYATRRLETLTFIFF